MPARGISRSMDLRVLDSVRDNQYINTGIMGLCCWHFCCPSLLCARPDPHRFIICMVICVTCSWSWLFCDDQNLVIDVKEGSYLYFTVLKVSIHATELFFKYTHIHIHTGVSSGVAGNSEMLWGWVGWWGERRGGGGCLKTFDATRTVLYLRHPGPLM